MGIKSEYRRMLNTTIYRLTIFEFIWMCLTMPVWLIMYYSDEKYFNENKQTDSNSKGE